MKSPKNMFCIVLIVLNASLLLFSNQGYFTVPENLKDNVSFWKKIYSEVSLSEVLIHDREYPLIIYKKVNIGSRSGRQKVYFIRRHIATVKKWLHNINHMPATKWSETEKKIFSLFTTYNARSAIKSAQTRVRYQQGQKERFRNGLEISGAYIDYIKKVFKKVGIPERIAYLPHVESSFNINAYSKVGACGLWQFMRRTGRLYLKINYKIDERRDPYLSTMAAAKLLKHNYSSLRSWPLAITAYNHGLRSMERAVRLTGTRDIGVIIEKYKNRRFRFASKNFYSCFLAASDIAEKPQQYFQNLSYHKPKLYQELKLDHNTRAATVLKELGISKGELSTCNPALRNVVFSKGYSIPKGTVLKFPARVDQQRVLRLNRLGSQTKEPSTDETHYYRIKKGDTLYGISRRYGLSTEILVESNDISEISRIYVGQVLIIPIGGKLPSPQKAKPKPVKPPAKTEPKEEVPIPAKADKSLNNSLIREGLSKLKRLIDFDKIAAVDYPDPFRKNNGGMNESFDSSIYNLDVQILNAGKIVKITVSCNETMGHYADWLGIPTYKIRRLNRRRRSHLNINQKLLLPVGKKDAVEHFNSQRLEYHMAIEEDFYGTYKVSEVKNRRVKYGESLWEILDKENEIPIWLFKKYNRDLNINRIRSRTVIKIPVVEKK